MGDEVSQPLICGSCGFVQDRPEARCFRCGQPMTRVPSPPPSPPPSAPAWSRVPLPWVLATVPLVLGALAIGLVAGNRLTPPAPAPSYSAPSPSYSAPPPVDYSAEFQRMMDESEQRQREELDRLAREQDRQLAASRQQDERDRKARELDQQREEQRRAQAEQQRATREEQEREQREREEQRSAQAERERATREEQERQRREREEQARQREAERNALQRYVCGHCGAELQRTKVQGSPFGHEGGSCEEGRSIHWWIRR